jgi:hypothetical protein
VSAVEVSTYNIIKIYKPKTNDLKIIPSAYKTTTD